MSFYWWRNQAFPGHSLATVSRHSRPVMKMLGVQRFCGYLVDNGEYPTIKECVQDLLDPGIAGKLKKLWKGTSHLGGPFF